MVKPDEVDGLGVVDGEDLATLFTCTPYGVNSHRLIVRGHRVPYVEADLADEKLPLSNMSLHTNYLLWVVVGLSVTGAFILFLLYRERKLKAASEKPDQTGQSEEKEQPDTVEETETAKEDGSAHIEGTGEPAEPNEPEEQP